MSTPTEKRTRSCVRRPETPAEQLELELWATRLGFYGWGQLTAHTGKVDGIPETFKCHLFRFKDHKEESAIEKRAAGKFLHGLYILQALAADYTQPSTKTDRVVTLFDGHEAYLLIVDEATHP